MDFFNTQIDSGQHTEVTPVSGLPQEVASVPVSYYLNEAAILLVLVGIVGVAVQAAALKRKSRRASQVKMLERIWNMTPEKIEE